MANRLRETVQEALYPLLEGRGFARVKSKDSRFVFFVKRLPSDTHVLVFQWDKYGGERFVINLSKLPSGNQPEMLGPFDVEWLARLQPSGSSPRWWSTRKTLMGAITSLRLSDESATVASAVAAAIPQAEAWLKSGFVGSHVQLLAELPPNTSLERTRER